MIVIRFCSSALGKENEDIKVDVRQNTRIVTSGPKNNS